MGIKESNKTEEKSKDFNIYYLNFTKVYEIAMMINNVRLTTVVNEHTKSFEKQYGYNSTLSAQGSQMFLDGIKASISADAKETTMSSARVVETLEVQTTKSTLLRRVIEQCMSISSFKDCKEGNLLKVDNVKLELLDEESLRQFLVLRRDALKGMTVEGIELNNLISSMLQDYAYLLKGKVNKSEVDSDGTSEEILIKIPLEMQTEFENKYIINDLLIGHVSIVGVYKGLVERDFISSNTFTYFQEGGATPVVPEVESKVIKSNLSADEEEKQKEEQGRGDSEKNKSYQFIDTLAIIQDISFNFEEQPILSWRKRLCVWFRSLFGRK